MNPVTSTASSYSGDRPVKRLLMFVGHYAGKILAPIWAVVAGLAIVQMWTGPLPWAAVAPIQASFLVLLLIRELVHDRNLCERDIDDGWKALLDPQGAVDRYMRRLRFVHDPRLQYGSLVAAIAALMLTGLGAGLPVAWRIVFTVGAVAATAAGTYLLMCQRTHQWLRRWCPLCKRRGDGGHQVVAPEPDPVGTANR